MFNLFHATLREMKQRDQLIKIIIKKVLFGSCFVSPIMFWFPKALQRPAIGDTPSEVFPNDTHILHFHVGHLSFLSRQNGTRKKKSYNINCVILSFKRHLYKSLRIVAFPKCSMYGIFTYIYPQNYPNVGK